jgi:hypothetical protein
MNYLDFTIAALATWRITHLFHAEEGPGRTFARVREAFDARGWAVLRCFLCLSVWTALPAALLAGVRRRQFVLVWPALSASAIFIERAAFPATFVDAATYYEDVPKPEEMESFDVLRQE